MINWTPHFEISEDNTEIYNVKKIKLNVYPSLD